MGSAGNDHIAPRGGLAINKKGNVLVFGDTNGEFYRTHDAADGKVNELFLMEVSKDGAHKPHATHTKVTGGASSSQPASAPAPAPTPSSPSGPQTTAPPFLINDSSSKENGLSRGRLTLIVVVGIIGAIVLIILLVCCCRRCRRQKTNAKVAVRDGILNVDKGNSVAKSPPPSSFQDHRVTDDNDDSIATNDII